MKNLKEIDFANILKNRNYTPSPESWEDQVLYFLVVDRFSQGNESDLYDYSRDYENAIKDDLSKEKWDKAGDKWNGGTLKGIKSKLGYLNKLGITTLWISPVFKQVSFEESYHGYGIQNFLEIDPHFGSREDLKSLVDEAHKLNMYIVMDIIINHSGNVFRYEGGDKIYNGSEFNVAGFNDQSGNPVIPVDTDLDKLNGDCGIWPSELMTMDTFTRKGQISNWDNDPEYIEGDFFSLKNINTGSGTTENFSPSRALKTIAQCYKYWIAFADIDGFRLDTVKHVYPGAIKYFVREMHEFAQTIGKSNFYIIGEITGGLNFAINIQNKTGIDAALGINMISEKLENTAKGYTGGEDFFTLFKNSELEGDDKYKWFNDNVVSMFDDHDMVSQLTKKSRFCADKNTDILLLNAIILNVMSPGIPCLYYGTEQNFDGSGDKDKYVRETMFGGDFGAFRSRGKHFFNDSNPLYLDISRVLKVRKENLCLRQGRTYLRKVSYDGTLYEMPHLSGTERYTGLIAWSRILSDIEIIIIINCHLEADQTVMVSIDESLHDREGFFYYLYDSSGRITSPEVKVNLDTQGKFIKASVPKHGCVILSNKKE